MTQLRLQCVGAVVSLLFLQLFKVFSPCLSLSTTVVIFPPLSLPLKIIPVFFSFLEQQKKNPTENMEPSIKYTVEVNFQKTRGVSTANRASGKGKLPLCYTLGYLRLNGVKYPDQNESDVVK